jgi:hypothetical protein
MACTWDQDSRGRRLGIGSEEGPTPQACTLCSCWGTTPPRRRTGSRGCGCVWCGAYAATPRHTFKPQVWRPIWPPHLWLKSVARCGGLGAKPNTPVVPCADGEVAAVPRPGCADRGLEQAEDPVTADEAVAGRRLLALLAVGGALVHHVVAAPPGRPDKRLLGDIVTALPRSTNSTRAAGETNGAVGVGVGGGGAEADSTTSDKESDDEHRRRDDGTGAHAAALLLLSPSV